MGLAEKIIRFGVALKAAGQAGPGKVQHPPLYSLYPGVEELGLATSMSPAALLQAYRGWVASCVDAISESCASVELRFFDGRSDDELAPDHPLVTLFKRPCPVFSRFAFTRLIFSWLEIEGDAFLYKAKDGLGVTRELWPIMPDRMRVVPDASMLVKGYLYYYNGVTIPFEASEIIHIKYPNPADLYVGMGTLQKAAYEYDTELFMKKYRVNMFKKGIRPPAVLQTDQELEEDMIKRTQDLWQKAYGGVDKQGQIAVLQAGLEYKDMKVGPIELDYLEGSRATRQDILGIFRVPAAKVGIVEDVNRSNGYELERTFQKDVIKPKLILAQEHWQKDVVEEFDSRIVARYDENVPMDMEFSLRQEQQDLTQGVQTINEVRKKRGMEEVPWGKVPLLPFSLMPIGSGYSSSREEPESDSSSDSSDDSGKSGTTEESALGGSGRPRLTRVNRSESPIEISEDFKVRAWKGFFNLHQSHARPFERMMDGLFRNQEAEVLRNLKKAMGSDQSAAAKAQRASLNPDFVLFSREEAERIFAEVADPAFRDMLIAGLRKGLSDMGSDAEPVIGDRLSRWLDLSKKKFSFEVNDTTLAALKSELTIGLQEAESLAQISQRVKNVFQFAEDFRAQRIAVTEATGTLNSGILGAYRMGGEDDYKFWLTTRQSNVRDSHQATDGQERGFDEPFQTGAGNALMYPGDRDCADPGDIINCYCTMLRKKKE